MKDLKPIKNLKYGMANTKALEEVEVQHHLCSDIQNKVGQALVSIREARRTILDCQKLMKEATQKVEENEIIFASVSNNMAKAQDTLTGKLALALLKSLTTQEKSKITKLLKTSPSFGKMSLLEVLEYDIRSGYDASFTRGEIVIHKPNPLIGKILVKDKKKEKVLAALKKDDKKKATIALKTKEAIKK